MYVMFVCSEAPVVYTLNCPIGQDQGNKAHLSRDCQQCRQMYLDRGHAEYEKSIDTYQNTYQRTPVGWRVVCLSATFVLINPVMDICVVYLRERSSNELTGNRINSTASASCSTEPRATTWLVCVLELVSLFHSSSIPVRRKQYSAERKQQFRPVKAVATA